MIIKFEIEIILNKVETEDEHHRDENHRDENHRDENYFIVNTQEPERLN